MYRKIKML